VSEKNRVNEVASEIYVKTTTKRKRTRNSVGFVHFLSRRNILLGHAEMSKESDPYVKSVQFYNLLSLDKTSQVVTGSENFRHTS